MDRPTETTRGASLSDSLAAERTFLAWIRTGIALMGFGFVVARFGLFLQQLQIVERAPATPSYGLSLWFGTALLVLGVVVNVLSAWHHFRLVRELERGVVFQSRPSIQGMLVALFLAVIGLAMAIYLVSVRSSAHHRTASSEEVSMLPATNKGMLRPPAVGERYTLSDAVQAYIRVASGKGGKIVLVMAPDKTAP